MDAQREPARAPGGGGAIVRRVLAIAATVAVLLVLVFELGLRAYDALEEGAPIRDWADPISRELAVRARVRPHPYLAYATRPSWRSSDGEEEISHNALGFRGPEIAREKPDGVYRVLCIGGSSVYGHHARSNETTWPARLEHYLNQGGFGVRIEVVNGGCQGYSTFEMLGNLAYRGLDLDPDLVITYETVNDMRCALWENRNGIPPQPDNVHWRAVWPVERESGLERWLEHSYTYLIWRRRFTGWYAERADLGSYVIAGYDPQTDHYYKSSPPEQGFENFERNLESIVALCRAREIRVLLTTQAIWRDGRPLDAAPSRESQLAAFDRMTGIVRTLAPRLKVSLCDAQVALEAEAQRVGHGALFMDDVHLRDPGNDVLALTIAKAIVAHGLIKPR